jgi:hypothetical protein
VMQEKKIIKIGVKNVMHKDLVLQAHAPKPS